MKGSYVSERKESEPQEKQRIGYTTTVPKYCYMTNRLYQIFQLFCYSCEHSFFFLSKFQLLLVQANICTSSIFYLDLIELLYKCYMIFIDFTNQAPIPFSKSNNFICFPSIYIFFVYFLLIPEQGFSNLTLVTFFTG